MGIILRRDKGSRLTITELDDNLEYLAMDSNDIDIYWNKDHTDSVTDSMFIGLVTNGLEKTFTSLVYQLGLSIKNYNIIADYNPEFIIERYKKHDRKVKVSQVRQSSSKFRLPDPYSDNVKASEMIPVDPSKAIIYRPMIFPITGSASYYRIYAENYFSQTSPPRVSGCKNSFYNFSQGNTTISDDGDNDSMSVPRYQTGSSYCRLRIRISDGLSGYKYSKPLKEFKIKMSIDHRNIPFDSRVLYDMI